MSAHTPLPWRIYRDSLPAVVSGSDDDDTFRYVAQDMTEADAEFIVSAANTHGAAALLETQLSEARAEAAGYRAHNEALQLQVVELNGELAAAERAAFADVAEIGRTLAVLRHAGINAEWVDGEMLSKISPAEGVEHLAARCELFRQLLEAAPHWSTSHEGMSKWHVRVSEALVTALANARKAVAP